MLRWLLVALIAVCGVAAFAACSDGGGDDDDRRESRRDRDEDDEERDEEDEERGDEEDEEDEDEPTTRPRRTATAEPDSLTFEDLIELTIEDLHAYWTRLLPDVYGVEYEPPDIVGAYDADSRDVPECGGEELPAGNAIYCPIGDYVAWDEEELLRPIFERGKDFAVALILAHEWGHAIQARGNEPVRPSILAELQADCFAGTWAAAVDNGDSDLLRLDPGDLDEAISGYLVFRDLPGTLAEEPGAHGSAFDRVNSFWNGFTEGPDFCADLTVDALVVFDLPLTGEDRETGGDLPLEEIIALTVADLERFWPAAITDAYGIEFGAFPEQIPFDPFDDDLPSCGPEVFDTDTIPVAFYCPPDDYVAWDEAGFIPTVYDNFGDFAVAFIFAHEWGHAVQQRANIDGATIDTEMQADCFGGAWARSVALDESPNLSLSAGDIDEAVAGFLEVRDPVGTPQSDPGAHGTAFQRVAAFRDGFLLGVTACKKFAAQVPP